MPSRTAGMFFINPKEAAVAAVGDPFDVCGPGHDIDKSETRIPALDGVRISETPLEQLGHAGGWPGDSVEDELPTG